MMKQTLYMLLTALIITSCSTTNHQPEDYPSPTVERLVHKPHRYDGQTVTVTAYVLGTKFKSSEHNAQFFILTLSDTPLSPQANSDRNLIFPNVKYKIRAAEDGYNGEVLKSSYIMAENARKLGEKITIIADFIPDQEFYFYETGINLYIRQLTAGGRTVNTDYGDKSTFVHSTPGVLKSIYQSGKKLFGLAKKLTL